MECDHVDKQITLHLQWLSSFSSTQFTLAVPDHHILSVNIDMYELS